MLAEVLLIGSTRKLSLSLASCNNMDMRQDILESGTSEVKGMSMMLLPLPSTDSISH